jgi:hypothetical protein
LRRLEEAHKESRGTKREQEELLAEVVTKLLVGWGFVFAVCVALAVVVRSKGVLSAEAVQFFLVEEVCGCTVKKDVAVGASGSYVSRGPTLLVFANVLLGRWGNGESERLSSLSSYLSIFFNVLPTSPTTVMSR